MGLFNSNGYLIQGSDNLNNVVKNFRYLGINAFYQYPLADINNIECRKLTNEQQLKKHSDNRYQILEFITDEDLFKRYVNCCFKRNINIRVLFIESSYSNEMWNGTLLQNKFLGYEYCPIPVDEQIITDLDWYSPFSKFRNNLNKYGLFNTYDEVQAFKTDYDKEFSLGKIGDGPMNAYICKVYETIITKNTGNTGDGTVYSNEN